VRRRLRAIDQDEAQRRKELGEAVQQSLPQGSVVKLRSAGAWETSETPLLARFQVQVPNFASRAGQRLVLPLGILHASGQNPLISARPTHPISFDYPYEVHDHVTLALPPNTQIESLPPHAVLDRGCVYESSFEKQGNSLRLKRTLKMQVYYLPAASYLALRNFLDQVRASDEHQATLKPAPEATKH
jgi:hypothetical protein